MELFGIDTDAVNTGVTPDGKQVSYGTKVQKIDFGDNLDKYTWGLYLGDLVLLLMIIGLIVSLFFSGIFEGGFNRDTVGYFKKMSDSNKRKTEIRKIRSSGGYEVLDKKG